jgi:phage terminase large subunit-like protein
MPEIRPARGDQRDLRSKDNVAQKQSRASSCRCNCAPACRGRLSGHLLESEDWDHVCLPLIAEEDELHEIGDFVWERKAGELLRPNQYTPRQLEDMKAAPGSPGFTLPIIISVDLAQSSGPRRSLSVAQVWTPWLGEHILVDQVRGQFDYDTLRKWLVRLCKRYVPSIVLIENNGWAQALAGTLRKSSNTVELVDVGGKSKIGRLAAHIGLIRQGKIKISDRVSDRDVFVDEVTAFPNVANDDQVDAMTQYLDYALNHTMPPRRQRAVAVYARQPGWQF